MPEAEDGRRLAGYRQDSFALLLIVLVTVMWLVYWQDMPLFWDTVSQAGRRASWFYFKGMGNGLLPAHLDSGHPVGFAWYLAGVWRLCGRTIAVTHWAMAPVLVGIGWQLYKWVQDVIPAGRRWAAGLLVVACPTLLAQASLVSPDLVLLLGFLLATRGIWRHQRLSIVIGSMLMVSVSLRGVLLLPVLMLLGLVFVSAKIRFRQASLKQVPWLVVALLPAGILALGYYIYHYAQTGWWFSTPNPAWAHHRDWAGWSGMLRNTAILAWRWLDLGRWAVLVVVVAGCWIAWRQKNLPATGVFLLSWSIGYTLLFGGVMIVLTNPISHRYLLPAFVGVQLLAAWLLLGQKSVSKAHWISWGLLLISLFSGHFYLYPRHIAQAWDASLIYAPYAGLRDSTTLFLRQHNIPLHRVATEFPAIGPIDRYDLSGQTDGFADRDTLSSRYFFYSNVMNDFSDAEFHIMERDWKVVRRWDRGRLYTILYDTE